MSTTHRTPRPSDLIARPGSMFEQACNRAADLGVASTFADRITAGEDADEVQGEFFRVVAEAYGIDEDTVPV